jgi:hypothetical protein
MTRKILKNLYPFIFGVFPVFSLYLNNYFQVEFFRAYRSIAVCIIVTGFLFLLLALVFRQKAYARLFTSFLIILALNYGALYSFLTEHPVFGINLGRARFLVPIVLVLLVSFTVLLVRNKKHLNQVDNYAGWVSVALLIVLGVNFILLRSSSVKARNAAIENGIAYSGEPSTIKPDIYQIILDGYTSSVILASDFQFENEFFEDSLKDMGFIIPQNSCSNYDSTLSSLGSQLNLDWVNQLVASTKEDPHSLRMVDRYVNNRTRSFLEDQGYKTFAFENEYKWALWSNADYYLSPRHRHFFKGSVNSFEKMLLNNTMMRLVINSDLKKAEMIFERLSDYPLLANLDKHEEQTFILDMLPQLPQPISPKFVYAHATITHVPFVFNVDGSMQDSVHQGGDDSDFTDPAIREGYIISIQYANKKLLRIVGKIIAEDPQAIIILQGDHGYPGDSRHAIFLAVYDTRQSIQGYETMTLINLYRLILNNWFGTNYEVLSNDLYQEIQGGTYEYDYLGTCEEQFNTP